MKRKLTCLILVLVLALGLLPTGAMAFNADNYKPNITKISVGEPITGADGRGQERRRGDGGLRPEIRRELF